MDGLYVAMAEVKKAEKSAIDCGSVDANGKPSPYFIIGWLERSLAMSIDGRFIPPDKEV